MDTSKEPSWEGLNEQQNCKNWHAAAAEITSWNHKKKSFFWNLHSFKNEFFPPFFFHLFFTPKCGRLLWKSMHFEVCFPFFCKNWKNIFKLWGLSEIYIIDNRWSVLNRQIGDGKMCMQNSENEWVVCLRLRGYNMTTVLSLCIWPLS